MVEVTKNRGMLLLGTGLILMGLLQVVGFAVPAIRVILAMLAIAAGVFILLGR